MTHPHLHPLLTLRHAFSEWQRLGRIEALCEEQIRARHRAAALRKLTDGHSTFNDYSTPNGDKAISLPDTFALDYGLAEKSTILDPDLGVPAASTVTEGEET